MSTIRSRTIMSLTYKLLDHFPVTLFGGIVRDVIVPVLSEGKNPFLSSFLQTEKINEISDIDLFTEEKFCIDDPSTCDLLISKLREWDWHAPGITELTLYGIRGHRIELTHTLTSIDVHIDFIQGDQPGLVLDADVNGFVFSKQHGLHLMRWMDSMKLEGKLRYATRVRRLERKILAKECEIKFSPMFLGYQQDAVRSVRVRRFVKMIRKGWNVTNIDEDIDVHKGEKALSDVCAICHEDAKAIWVELKSSKCIICLNCFETLLIHDVPKLGHFRCPKSRKEIIPWSWS